MAKNGTTTAAPPARRDEVQPPAVPKQRKELASILEEWSGRIQAALPAHLSADRMIQVVRTLHYRTPKLQECDAASIVASVMRAASLGLDLEPSMMEGFLIPRYNGKTRTNECQFQIGYQGVRKLALQSGQVSVIDTRLVRANDYFECRYAPSLVLDHRPVFGPDAGPVILVYGYAKLANGESTVEVMTVDEVEAIHRRSEGYKTAQSKGWTESGPWVTDWNEMARKTVLKRLAKSLPRSLDLARAIDQDDDDYREGEAIQVSGSPRAKLGNAGLKQRLQIEADEPTFTPDEGVSRPVYTEADDDGIIPEDITEADIHATEGGRDG